MTRDIDLLRNLLFQIEFKSGGRDEDISIDIADTDEIVVNEHLRLLWEGGYIDAHKIPDDECDYFHYIPVRLTNEGHDFLDAVRSDTVWAKTKSRAVAAGAYTLKFLVQAAFDEAKRVLLS